MTCADVPIERGFIREAPADNELAGVDERKRLGIVAALKIDRLALGAVDVNRLARVQADANARRQIATLIGTVPHHDVDGAMATTRLVERDDALTANRREDGLVRPDRPQVLSKVFGSCRETGGEGNESTRRSEPQEPASTERKHRKSPSKHRPKTILSLKESLAHFGKKRCGVCHTTIVGFATHHVILTRRCASDDAARPSRSRPHAQERFQMMMMMMSDARESAGSRRAIRRSSREAWPPAGRDPGRGAFRSCAR